MFAIVSKLFRSVFLPSPARVGGSRGTLPHPVRVHGVSAEQGSGFSGVIVRSSAGTGSYFFLISYVLRFVFISYCGDLFLACCVFMG